ncbi:hypothetical protein P7C71_g2236, partial [Lecanoromycetidae sp. Uapishka_2]
MDPVSAAGLIASIVSIVSATAQTVQYLNDVKDAPKDRGKISQEAISLLGLLTSLRDRLDNADPTEPWFARLLSLGTDGGPLKQYEKTLEEVAAKLRTKSGIMQIGQRLLWTLDKKQAKDILERIERLKTLIGIALQEDNFALSQAIKDQMSHLGQGVIGISESVDELKVLQSLDAERRLDERSQAVISWLSPLNFAAKQVDVLAGAGKTILTSIVVDYLEDTFAEQGVVVAYIYNDYKEHEAHTAVNLVGSLLQQVLRKKRVISDEMTALHRKHVLNKTRPTISELSRSLKQELRSFSDVFIIVDAIDECTEVNGVRDRVLTEISGLHENPNIHLMLTSRPLAGLETRFRDPARLEIIASDSDIEKYLEVRLIEEQRLARLIKDDTVLQNDIIAAIVSRAKGMFLIATLHVDALAKKQTKRNVRLAYQSLPEGINSTYDEAMRRINQQDEDDAQLANRHALATEPNAVALDEEALPDEDLLTSLCAGLVVIETESQVIRFVHYTTQEYFERIRTDRFPTAAVDIALTCLTYLIDPIPFYVMLLLTGLLMSEGAWKNMHKFNHRALQEAAYMGHYEVARILVKHGASLKSGLYSKPLLLASERGHKDIMSLLIKAGADVQAAEITGFTALHAAARDGDEIIVQLLLNAGANVNATWKTETALSLAVWYKRRVTAQLLLEAGADIDMVDSNGDTALIIAVRDQMEMFQLLIEYGAAKFRLNAEQRLTVIERASSGGSVDVVQLLLEAGVDVNGRDEEGKTALDWATILWGDDMVQLLEKAGAQHGEGLDHVPYYESDETSEDWENKYEVPMEGPEEDKDI